MNNWPAWAKILIIIGIVLAFITLCCCMALAGIIIYSQQVDAPTGEQPLLDFEFPDFSSPTIQVPEIEFPTPNPESNPSQETSQSAGHTSQDAWINLQTLQQTVIPVSDLRELAKRLGQKGEIPLSVPVSDGPIEVGKVEKFWVSNMDTDKNFEIEATLRDKGEHVYFWVENGIQYSPQDMQNLVDVFDQEIYSTNRSFFGTENSPGVDNDERLYILYASNIGSSLVGYFSSADAVHPLAHPYSNAHEMFVMNADNAPLDDEYTYGVLAHEFQHMIHWNLDRNEESWLNEGFSELASFINGYDPGSSPFVFASNPDIQLNTWPDYGESYPYYGSSYLFVSYILDRFGNEFTQDLVKNSDNGMDSLDDVLNENQILDAETNSALTAENIFADWTIANFINEPNISEGQYGYSGGTDVPEFFPEETHYDCPISWQTSQVSQYGADYIEFICDGNFTLEFQGVNEVQLMAGDAFSGDYAIWSNRGDESDMTLTRAFDFSGISGEILLEYEVWYDIEEGWDYAYLTLSPDGGKTWTILETVNGTDYNPQGNAYGWGYTGSSNGWQHEEVNLSSYAGEKVLLRFEYVTDAAVNKEGLLLDDISIEAAGYSSDFEKDDGGWSGEGFVRIQNRLPQTFAISVISTGRKPEVQTYFLDDVNQISIPINVGDQIDSVVLVVSGTTRFTTQPAIYRYQVTP